MDKIKNITDKVEKVTEDVTHTVTQTVDDVEKVLPGLEDKGQGVVCVLVFNFINCIASLKDSK